MCVSDTHNRRFCGEEKRSCGKRRATAPEPPARPPTTCAGLQPKLVATVRKRHAVLLRACIALQLRAFSRRQRMHSSRQQRQRSALFIHRARALPAQPQAASGWRLILQQRSRAAVAWSVCHPPRQQAMLRRSVLRQMLPRRMLAHLLREQAHQSGFASRRLHCQALQQWALYQINPSHSRLGQTTAAWSSSLSLQPQLQQIQ